MEEKNLQTPEETVAEVPTEETVETALEQYNEAFEENLRELLRGKYSRYLADITDKKSVEKAKNALVRYGYSYDEINRGIAEYFE